LSIWSNACNLGRNSSSLMPSRKEKTPLKLTNEISCICSPVVFLTYGILSKYGFGSNHDDPSPLLPVNGIVGPILLMTGLARTEAATASHLLTLEGVVTAVRAWFIFQENFDRRIAIGMACLVLGAIVLSWSGQPTLTGLFGPLAVVGACIAWGLDNNLTRKVSLTDPLQIVELKGLIAGP